MITLLFRVRLDYTYPEATDDGNAFKNCVIFEDELLALTRGAVHSELFIGNPACGPYLIAEYSTLAEAQAAEAKLIEHIQVHKKTNYFGG